MVSYTVGFALAMIFSLPIIFELLLFRAFLVGHNPTWFSLWLRKHQSTSLWSQLFFSLTVSLACLVRQYQPSCPIYEAYTISPAVSITLISLILTLSAVYQRIERIELFIVLFLATLTLSIFAAAAPALTLKKFNGILQVCVDVAKDQGLPWGNGTIPPFHNVQQVPEAISDLISALASIAVWYYLWLRRAVWMQNSGVRSLWQVPNLRLTKTCQISKPKWRYRIMLVLLSLGSIRLLWVVLGCFVIVLRRRRAIRIPGSGRAVEDVWGVGQIGAPLAWGPLLFEIGHSVLKSLWPRRGDVTNKTRRASYAVLQRYNTV